MADLKVYETTNVDLGSFLVLEGIKLIECSVKDPHKRIIVMRFLDEASNCLDLERVYLSSEFKKFRDINKWLLKKIHSTLREQ